MFQLGHPFDLRLQTRHIVVVRTAELLDGKDSTGQHVCRFSTATERAPSKLVLLETIDVGRRRLCRWRAAWREATTVP